MAISNGFMRKKVEKYEHLYILFSAHTHLPFIECDKETYDDQIYVFSTEEKIQAFAKTFAERKIPLRAVRIPQKLLKSFFTSLYQYGISAVILQDEGEPVRIPISDLAQKPDIEKLRASRMPGANPELQLTGIYFAQELYRPVTRTDQEKALLRDMEEEMVHNMSRSRFILAFDVTDLPDGEASLPDGERPQAKMPLIRLKDGKLFLPIYTEMSEFRRFTAKEKKKMRLLAVPFADLPRLLPGGCSGYVFNPSGFNLLMTREQLQAILQRYQSITEEGSREEK